MVILINCETCEKEFDIYPYEKGKRRFCSPKCYWNRKPKIFTKECEVCGKGIKGKSDEKRICDECKIIKKNKYMKEYNQRPEIKLRDKERNRLNYLNNKEEIQKKNKLNYMKHREERLLQQKKYRKKHKVEIRKQKKIYREEHKEELRKYREENKERLLKKQRERYWENREKYLESGRNWKKNNKDKINQYKRTEKVKEGRNKHRRKREKEDIEYNMKHRLRSHLLSALKKYAKTGKVWVSKQYGIDYEKIIEYLKPLPKNLQDYEVHHLKPLFTFNFINDDDSQNLEEIKKAFAPENHKLLLVKEHRKLNHWKLI